jgi:CDP-paratose 2-epimerase
MKKKILITGGAGFIGCNAVAHFIKKGYKVTIFDNLSRSGSEKNIDWLSESFGSSSFEFIQNDIRDFNAVVKAIERKNVVLHLAGQVAVTSSVIDPRTDYEINVLGTFNILEAARLYGDDPIVLFSSTNKVYGGMEQVNSIEKGGRYVYEDFDGISENFPLDFHSPYGCSKGSADQYVRDYARIFNLRTIVFRQSCIYGPRQMGVEDQGWLAWFCIAVLKDKPITIYGDGKQVRDILFVEDLINAYEMAIERIDITSGKIYNIGGGPNNTLSIWSELGKELQQLCGHKINVLFNERRPGDQNIYISDISMAKLDFDWFPQVGVKDGIERLWLWAKSNRHLF